MRLEQATNHDEGFRPISMRAEKDFNIRADKNINMEAGENVHIKAGMSHHLNTGDPIHLGCRALFAVLDKAQVQRISMLEVICMRQQVV